MNALKLEKLMDYQPGYIENQVNFRIGNGYFEDMLWDCFLQELFAESCKLKIQNVALWKIHSFAS
jgi:hypothetical protein